MLSDKQLRDVCLAYDNSWKRCRFLSNDDDDFDVYHCMKKGNKKSEINVEIDIFIQETRKKGKDPYKENIAMGDNCSGYPVLKHTLQGYDI